MIILRNQCSNHSFCNLSSGILFTLQSVENWHVVLDVLFCFFFSLFEIKNNQLWLLVCIPVLLKCSFLCCVPESALWLKWIQNWCVKIQTLNSLRSNSKVLVLIRDSSHNLQCKTQTETQCSCSHIPPVLVQCCHRTLKAFNPDSPVTNSESWCEECICILLQHEMHWAEVLLGCKGFIV